MQTIGTIMKNAEALVDATKEVGLDINRENYKLIFHHQNAEQNYNTKTAHNRSLEFRYFGMTVTNQNKGNQGQLEFR
jgi:hypothetical protein